MPRPPRSEVFDEQNVGIYHCVNRCVRQSFLLGYDATTGKSYEHRKDWVRERLEFLAGIFAIDVIGYGFLDNHLHVVLRNRPDLVRQWSNDEVARRWWNLCPKRREKNGHPADPKPNELRMLTTNRKKLSEARSRLSHISWLMRFLTEPIARRANKEDQVTGRFWAGRYKMTRILDEAALLAVVIYVDLNPIRAGIAATPEASRYTSAYDRIRSRNGQRRGPASSTSPENAAPDRWLSPVPLDRDLPKSSKPRFRASNLGFLEMTTDEYLTLLDWTGRQVRRDKRGHIPQELAPILDRLNIVPENWLDTVTDFGQTFRTAAGRYESLAAEADRRGRNWLHGMTASRKRFF